MSSMEPLEANGNNAAIPSSVNPVEAMAIATSLDAASTNVPTTPKDTADAHQANTAVGTSETVSNKGEQVEAKPTKVAVTVTPTDQLAPTENMENGVVEGATGSTTAVTPANVAKESTQAVDEDKCVGDNEADNVKDKEKDMDVKGDEATDVKRDEVKNAGENTKGNDAKGEEEVEPKPKRRKVVYIPIPRASPRLASRAAAKEKEEAAATQDPKPKDEEEEEDGDDGNFVPSSSSGKRGAKRAYGKEGQDNHPHSHYPILMPKEFTPAHEDWIRIRYTETIGKFRAKRTIDDFEDHYRVRVVNPHVSADARMAECLITNVFRRHEKRLRLRAAGEENTEPKKWKYGPRFKKPQVKLSMTKTKKPQPDIWEPSKKIKTETSAPLPPQRASTRTTAASKRAAQDAAARAAAKKSHTEDAVALLSLSAAAESASNAAAAAAAAQSSGTVAQPAAATSSRSQV